MWEGISTLLGSLFGGNGGGGASAAGSAMGGFDEAMNFGTGATNNLISDPISSMTDINTGQDAYGNAPGSLLPGRGLNGAKADGTDFMSGFKDLMGEGGFGDLFKMGMAIPQFLEQRSQNDEMMKMMKQQMALQEREADRYRQSLNSGMRDRQRGRLAATDENGKNIVNPHYQSVGDYMKENRIA